MTPRTAPAGGVRRSVASTLAEAGSISTQPPLNGSHRSSLVTIPA